MMAKPAPTKYIWNWGLNFMADVGYPDFSDNTHPEKVKFLEVQKGGVVWVRTWDLPWFFETVFPEMPHEFILMNADGVWSIPGQLEKHPNFDLNVVLDDPRLIHWYTQNCDYRGSSSKISPLPLGLDFHTIAKGNFWGETRKSPLDQEAELESILSRLKPTSERIGMIYTDIHLNNSSQKLRERWGENRADIARQVDGSGCVQFQARRLKRSLYWRILGQYAFSISGHGTGMDCHRTWESLVLGNILIVKTSPLDKLYAGLPVVIVPDWSEITAQSLDHWLSQYGGAFDNPDYRERLTNSYWMEKIRARGITVE